MSELSRVRMKMHLELLTRVLAPKTLRPMTVHAIDVRRGRFLPNLEIVHARSVQEASAGNGNRPNILKIIPIRPSQSNSGYSRGLATRKLKVKVFLIHHVGPCVGGTLGVRRESRWRGGSAGVPPVSHHGQDGRTTSTGGSRSRAKSLEASLPIPRPRQR